MQDVTVEARWAPTPEVKAFLDQRLHLVQVTDSLSLGQACRIWLDTVNKLRAEVTRAEDGRAAAMREGAVR